MRTNSRRLSSWHARRSAISALAIGCLTAALTGPALASSVPGSAPAVVPAAVGDLQATMQATMLGDLNLGAASSLTGQLERASGRVFFVADDGTHGPEPWVSDGTPEGTVMVADLVPGPGGSPPYGFVRATNGVVFLTDTRNNPAPGSNGIGSFWSTTATGTGGDVGTTTLLGTGPDRLGLDTASFRGAALITTSDFEGNAQLWRSDGTATGTKVVRRNFILPDELTPADDVVYFLDGQNPLWRTDGTSTGTREVKTFPDNRFGSTIIFQPTALGSRVFFTLAEFRRAGDELGVSDGTRTGTHLARDIRPGLAGSRPAWLTPRGRLLYFVANDGAHRGQLWRSNGTRRGTVRLTNLPGRPLIQHLTSCHGSLYFTATDARGNELWARHGDPVRTHRIADLAPGPGSSRPRTLTCLQGGLVFSADDGVHGRELWTIPGPGGTPVLHDLSPSGSSAPRGMVRVGTKVLFTASEGSHGREPWVLAPAG